MASRTLPGIGLKGFWALGEDGWKADNDTNLLMLSALVQPRVLDIVSATPGAPANGDIYFFDADHPTQANDLAIRDNGAWVYIPAFEGMKLTNLADDRSYVFVGGALRPEGRLAVETEAGAAYSLVAGDVGKHKRFTNAAAVVTISAGEFEPGERIRITDVGGGLTLDDDGGAVTLNSRDGALTSAGAMAVIEVECVDVDEFDVLGDLTV